MKKPATITTFDAEAIVKTAGYPYNLIFRLAAESGYRISDIVNLTYDNIDFDNNLIFLMEKKSQKHRAIKISNWLNENLKRHKTRFKLSNFVFFSRTKNYTHIHRSTVHRALKRIIKHLGIDCSSHSFRRLYAQRLYNHTKSIKVVQQALNHGSERTTAAYLDDITQ